MTRQEHTHRIASSCESLESRLFLAAGSLVPTFGDHGIVIGDLAASYFDRTVDALVENDGDIVVLGTSWRPGGQQPVLVRFRADGSLDPGFGTGGIVMIDAVDRPVAVGIQPSGKIVIMGGISGSYELDDGHTYGYEWTRIVRFNTDGSRDMGFGGSGSYTRAEYGGWSGPNEEDANPVAMSIIPDGRILFYYWSFQATLPVMLLPDGQLDPNPVWFGGTYAFQEDGGMVFLGGYRAYSPPAGQQAILSKTNSDGSVDTGFGTNGVVLLKSELHSTFSPSDLAVKGGQIRVVGIGSSPIPPGIQRQSWLRILSLTSTGQWDATFGIDGIAQVNIPNTDYADATFLNDSSVLLMYRLWLDADSSFGPLTLMHFTANGQIDRSFGTDGTLVTSFRPTEAYKPLPVGQNGEFLIAGTVRSQATADDLAVLRFLDNGAVDTSFGTNGAATVEFKGSAKDEVIDTAPCPGGDTIILARSNELLVLARYGKDGKLVNTFGDAGVLRGLTFGSRVAVDKKGRIYVAGVSGQEVLVYRYQPTGGLDNTFGQRGVAHVFGPIDGLPSGIDALRIQNDGSFCVVTHRGDSLPILIRCTTAGKLDKTFGTAGTVTLSTLATSWVTDIAFQRDGKIVALRCAPGGKSQILRLHRNGRMDRTFGKKGIASMAWSASHMGLQPDGGIIVAGDTQNKRTRRGQMTIQRYDASGRLDRKFGSRGRTDYLVPRQDIWPSFLTAQADGRILTVVNNVVVRFNANGVRDNGFARRGIATIRVQNTTPTVKALLVRMNTDIIVVGNTDKDLLLARLRAN